MDTIDAWLIPENDTTDQEVLFSTQTEISLRQNTRLHRKIEELRRARNQLLVAAPIGGLGFGVGIELLNGGIAGAVGLGIVATSILAGAAGLNHSNIMDINAGRNDYSAIPVPKE